MERTLPCGESSCFVGPGEFGLPCRFPVLSLRPHGSFRMPQVPSVLRSPSLSATGVPDPTGERTYLQLISKLSIAHLVKEPLANPCRSPEAMSFPMNGCGSWRPGLLSQKGSFAYRSFQKGSFAYRFPERVIRILDKYSVNGGDPGGLF